MSATAEAVIRHGRVVCSRCGGTMKPRLLWHEDNGNVTQIFWACPQAHMTQALPLPDNINERRPRL